MIEFGGNVYFIDIDSFSKMVTIENDEPLKNFDKKYVLDEEGKIIQTEVLESIRERTKELEAAKYDILRELLMVVLDYDNGDEDDVLLGAERALSKTPLSYQIAFNTLINYGVLKEKEKE
jgi:regulator of PEP synthase PpsR (kinase-PPPase family)